MGTFEAAQYFINNGKDQGIISAISKNDENYNSIWKISFKNSSVYDQIMISSDENNVFVAILDPSLITCLIKLDFITGQLILSKCNQYLMSNANSKIAYDRKIGI